MLETLRLLTFSHNTAKVLFKPHRNLLMHKRKKNCECIFQLQVSLIEIIRLCSLEYNKCVYIISALVFAFLVIGIGERFTEMLRTRGNVCLKVEQLHRGTQWLSIHASFHNIIKSRILSITEYWVHGRMGKHEREREEIIINNC